MKETETIMCDSDGLEAKADELFFFSFPEEIKKEIPCSPPPEVDNGETIVWGEGLLLEYR